MATDLASQPSLVLTAHARRSAWSWSASFSHFGAWYPWAWSWWAPGWCFSWGPSAWSASWWGWNGWWGSSPSCFGWWWRPWRVCSWWWPWWYSAAWYPSSTVVYGSDYPSTVVYVEERPAEVVQAAEAYPVAEDPEATTIANGGTAGGSLAYAPGESVAEKYVRLGDLYFRAGRYDRAVSSYLRGIDFSPDQGSLYFLLADALVAIGDYHYAAFALRRGVEKDPALVESRVNKREFYGEPADIDRHLALLEGFVRDHGNDGDARFVLGVNYLFTGRPKEAREAFARAKENLVADRALDLFLASADVRAAEADVASRPTPP